MERELAVALEPVLRDLAKPGGVLPDVRDEAWSDVPRTASAMLWAADGSGTGVSLELGKPGSTQIAALADQVQEWAVEALWSLRRPTNWPPCPHHPGSHPLAPTESDGRAVWICPADNSEVSEIGSLAE
jgi:hypothetical protein